MRTLYEQNTANYPRMKTDTFFSDYENRFSYRGIMDRAIRSIEDAQLLDRAMWKRFADQFRLQDDSDGSWRGEFWGKAMRGAALTYSYTQSAALYEILTETVEDMLTVAEADGRVSSYSRETEFTVVGSCGCTFEFFDHAAVRQASPENDLAQETCVTVTMMKYLY